MSRWIQALLAPSLLFLVAGCAKQQVSYYAVPHEDDPQLPAGANPDPAAAPFAANGGGMANAQVPTAAGPGLVWQAPASWRPKAASAMRKGSYSVGPAGDEADLSITAFPGDVGGELANVNRWRGQVQLPPLDDSNLAANVSHFSSHGLAFTLVDLKGEGSSKRILGAIVPYSDGTWFFKLMGSDAVVSAARPEFLAFLRTVAPSSAP